MVSTRVCGTLGLGSNPSRHPKQQISLNRGFCFNQVLLISLKLIY